MRKTDGDHDRALALLAADAPSQTALEEAIVSMGDRAVAAERRLDELSAARGTVLVEGTHAQLVAHDAEATAETFRRDQAVAVRKRLEEKLVPVVAAGERAAIAAERKRIEGMVEDAAAALANYPHLVETFRTIIAAVARADAAALQFALDHPNEEAIPHAEGRVRHIAERAEVVGETVVWAWATSAGKIFCDASVKPDDRYPENKGLIRSFDNLQTASRNCGDDVLCSYQQAFDRNLLQPSSHHVFRSFNGSGAQAWPVKVRRRLLVKHLAVNPPKLADSVSLPPLMDGGVGWQHLHASHPTEVFERLKDAPASLPRPAAKVIEMELLEPFHADAPAPPPLQPGEPWIGAKQSGPVDNAFYRTEGSAESYPW